MTKKRFLSSCDTVWKAGIQPLDIDGQNLWTPAFAGMTDFFEFKSKNTYSVVKVINDGTRLRRGGVNSATRQSRR
jgi:hypothetical protein